MKRLISNAYYANSNERTSIIAAETMLIVVLVNFLLVYKGISENINNTLSFNESVVFASINLILFMVQIIFSAIEWETKFYKIVARISLWSAMLSLPTMIISTMFALK